MIRPVESAAELDEVLAVVGAEFTPAIEVTDRRFAELRAHQADDGRLMLVVAGPAGTVGGALGFRQEDGTCILRTIALVPSARGRGLGRRLVETLEAEALEMGCLALVAGGIPAGTKGFYARLGFHGRGSTMRLDLPPPGPVRDLRLRRLRAAPVARGGQTSGSIPSSGSGPRSGSESSGRSS